MTNKAKTYLKNIQGADTEKKLIEMCIRDRATTPQRPSATL